MYAVIYSNFISSNFLSVLYTIISLKYTKSCISTLHYINTDIVDFAGIVLDVYHQIDEIVSPNVVPSPVVEGLLRQLNEKVIEPPINEQRSKKLEQPG